MATINRHNYEEYYLDYLEGNLSAALVVEMELFLTNNPDLAMDAELPSFSAVEEASLDTSFKNQLKVTDFNGEINAANLDDFMIAQMEGELSERNSKRLDQKIGSNPEWKKTQRLFAFTKLQPDLSILFAEKSSLKKARVINLRPLVAMLAAASVISLVWFLIPENNSPLLKHGAQMASYTLPEIGKKDVSNPRSEVQTPKANTSNTAVKWVAESKPVKINFSVDKLDLQAMTKHELPSTIEASRISHKPLPVETYAEETVPSQDYAIAMKDRGKPITRALSDAIKQEVVYQKGVNSVKERSGFYLKIGKFELYSNHRIKPKE